MRHQYRNPQLYPAVVLLLIVQVLGSAYADSTTRASVCTGGTESNGFSVLPALSNDGRYIAFASDATTLVSGVPTGVTQIYVRDRAKGTTELVSQSSAGVPGNAESLYPTITANGRYVAYTSSSTNLVAGDTNASTDVFVFDRETRQTQRVSLTSTGQQCNGDSYHAAICAKGNCVAFLSKASNIVPDAGGGIVNVYLRDLQAGTTERVSTSITGSQANATCDFFLPAISAGGQYVAFNSLASNLVPNDTNGVWDVFVRDRKAGAMHRISVSAAGVQGNGDSHLPSLSADGRYVAFYSWADNLVSSDTNGKVDVFVADQQTGTVERVSVASDSGQANNDSNDPSISADGRFIAFKSQATNLVPGDSNGVWDAFVYDRQQHVTARVDVSSSGGQADNTCDFLGPKISGNGAAIAYNSLADNLVAADTNGNWDVFVGVVPSVRSGLPRFVTDPPGHTYLSIRLYARGFGQAALTGSWRVNGRNYSSFSNAVDLSTGEWTAATELQVPWITSQANPTIDCAVDAPIAMHTGTVQCWVTGFDPAQHGWQFANSPTWTDPNTWSIDGLCLGMSALARNDFIYGPPISSETLIGRGTWFRIRAAHLEDNIYVDGPFIGLLYRAFDLSRLVNYGSPSALFVNETNRLRDDVAAGRPNVMLLKPRDDTGRPTTGGHAVVAIAAFYCEDVWVPGLGDDHADARLFAVYDPNFPRQFRHVYVTDDGGSYALRFLPDVSSYNNLKFLGEFTKDP